MALVAPSAPAAPAVTSAPGVTHSAAVTAPRVAAAVPTAALPGGGTRIFQGKSYVALYGHPGTRVLGVLGEQGTAATIRRAKRVAATYQPHTTRRVVPALEIITTIASASAAVP